MFMKTTFFFIALFLGHLMILNAQELLLPVSTSSEAAKAEYTKGLQAADHANIPDFMAGMKAAVKTDPNFFMAHAYLALTGTSFEQYEEAAAFIKSALAIDPAGFNQGEQILREALQALAEDPKADPAPFMASLTAAYPNTAQAHELAATSASWISKDPQAAVQHSLRLVELRPEHGGGYNALGYSYMALGEMDKAKAAFEQYLALAPDEANAYDSMGEYYLVTKDYAKSVEHYDRAVAMGMEGAKERAEKAREAMKEAGK
jgi:tetratricopeptide (TPR) repeat protein